MLRLAMMVLWPSFLAATLAVGCFFSMVEPAALWDLPALAVYTLGFFFCWTLCALASALTCYLATLPGDHGPPL